MLSGSGGNCLSAAMTRCWQDGAVQSLSRSLFRHGGFNDSTGYERIYGEVAGHSMVAALVGSMG